MLCRNKKSIITYEIDCHLQAAIECKQLLIMRSAYFSALDSSAQLTNYLFYAQNKNIRTVIINFFAKMLLSS